MMLKNNTFLRIFSLVAAILMWVYVMGEVDPQTKIKVRYIPVKFVNENVLQEKNLAVVADDEIIVTATIKGKRSQVNDIKKTGLTASVDVSSCRKGQNKSEIVINVPDGISVENISDKYLNFKVEDLAVAEKPIDIGISEKITVTEKLPWVISTDPTVVNVIGAESAVAKVVVVKGIVSSENISEETSRWVYTSVTPVNKAGERVPGVSIVESDSVGAQIKLLTLKTVNLDLLTENLDSNLEIEEMDKISKIQIIGEADIVEDIDKIQGTLDLTGVTGSAEIDVNLNLPEGVYLYNKQNMLTVTVKVKAVE